MRHGPVHSTPRRGKALARVVPVPKIIRSASALLRALAPPRPLYPGGGLFLTDFADDAQPARTTRTAPLIIRGESGTVPPPLPRYPPRLCPPELRVVFLHYSIRRIRTNFFSLSAPDRARPRRVGQRPVRRAPGAGPGRAGLREAERISKVEIVPRHRKNVRRSRSKALSPSMAHLMRRLKPPAGDAREFGPLAVFRADLSMACSCPRGTRPGGWATLSAGWREGAGGHIPSHDM